MSGKPFFDTNVLVYIVGQAVERTEAAEALLAAGAVVSVQVLNELAAVASHRRDAGDSSSVHHSELKPDVRAGCQRPAPSS